MMHLTLRHPIFNTPGHFALLAFLYKMYSKVLFTVKYVMNNISFDREKMQDCHLLMDFANSCQTLKTAFVPLKRE